MDSTWESSVAVDPTSKSLYVTCFNENEEVDKFSTFGTQVEKNISRTRWIGPNDGIGLADRLATEYFLVSTYADQNNEISLWKVEAVEGEEKQTLQTKIVHKAPIPSNIMGLEALDSDHFALTTSKGELILFKLSQRIHSQAFAPVSFQLVDKKQVHQFRPHTPAPATDLTVLDSTALVTVGEDGSLVYYSTRTKDVVRSLEHADPFGLTVVSSIGRNEVVTGNSSGQVKVWDLRVQSSDPVITMFPNNPLNTLCGTTSVAQYPSQSHLLLSGYQSGCMDLWDIRKGSGSFPTVNLLNDGSGAISEILFHKVNEDNFFTCNQHGSVTHWYPSTEQNDETFSNNMEAYATLNLEFLRKGLACTDMYTSCLPINSISVSQNDRLLCGGDSGLAVICDVEGV